MRFFLLTSFLLIRLGLQANSNLPRVLFLLSYEENFPTYFEFRKAFDEHPIHNNIIADFFYLDTKYSSSDEYLTLISEFVYEKYLKRHQYNAVLTYDDNALKVINRILKKNNLSIPVIFGGLNNESLLTSLEGFPITGVIENIGIVPTIKLMISLKPNLNIIYVIVDETETANTDLMKFYKTMGQFPDLGYKIISLSEYTFEEFYNYVSKLYDKNGAFLLLGMYKDNTNHYSPFYKGLKSLVDSAQMPIFHIYNHGIGQGVVGGVVVDHHLLTKKCLSILNSVVFNNQIPPIDRSTPLFSIVDKAQVTRYKLKTLNIPDNVLMVDSKKNFINISRVHLKSLIALIIGLISIILFFLILIRKLRNTNARLRQEREFYQKLFIESPSPIFIINPETFSIEEVNLAAVNLYSYTHEEFKQIKISELNKLPDDIIKTAIDDIFRGQISRISAKHYKKSGEVIFIESFNSPLWYKNGWRIITVVLDQTERKLLELNLQNALEKAQENEQLKASFLRAMNHEIRTPLNGILGFTQLIISKTRGDNDLHRYFSVINSCSQRMVEIIENILDLSLIENRQMQIHISEFNITEIIDFCVEKYAALIEPDTIKLIVNKPKGNEPCWVVSDRNKISKIIQHLLSNAIKFTHKGFVELNVYEENDHIIISVKDTGIGIEPKHQTIIYDRFRQIDMDSTRRYEGCGIGLTLVKEFITMLNGKIDLYSTPNKGSQFIVSLPKRIEVDAKSKTSELLFTSN